MSDSQIIEDNIMTLTDQDGKEVDVEFLGLIDYDKKEYLFLVPAEEDSEELFILQVEDSDDGEETYVPVEDEKLVDFLYDLFKEENKDTYEFVN